MTSLVQRVKDIGSVPLYRFAALFVIYLVAVALIYPQLRIVFSPAVDAAEAATAKVVYHFLHLFTDATSYIPEKGVSYRGFPVTIIEECTGIYEALILGAAVMAYPTTWWHTLTGLVLGLPLLYLMNLLRIAALLIVGHYDKGLFEFMHLYFWQVTMIIMVTSVWLLWLLWVERSEGSGISAA